MPLDGATATPTTTDGRGSGGDSSQSDPYRFLSTRLVRELIAADVRAESANDDPRGMADRILAVVAEGLGLPGVALLDAAELGVLASRGLEVEEASMLRSDATSSGTPLARRAIEERRVFLLGPGSRETLLPALREIRKEWTELAIVPLCDREQCAGVLVLLSTESRMPAAFLRSLTPAFRLLTLLLHPGRRSEISGGESGGSAADSERFVVEIEELRAQLGEAREQCRALENQESSSQAAQRAESESLRARVAELEAALASGGNQQIEAFELERSRHAAELEEREARVAALENEVGSLTRRLEQAETSVREAETAVREAEERAAAYAAAEAALREAARNDPEDLPAADVELEPASLSSEGDELRLGEIAEAAAAAMGDLESGEAAPAEGEGAEAPGLAVEESAPSQEPAAGPALGLWLMDSHPSARTWASELAGRCGAQLWTGEGEPPVVARSVLVMNLFEPSVARAIELAQSAGPFTSLAYAADAESGQGFELGPVGWVTRPLDPAAALRRIQASVPRRLGGIVIVSAQLRELAGLRQALAEVDAAGSVACDARQAADLLEIVRRPDAVLIDLTLDGGQGLALARQLRSNPETSDVPLLFLLPERIDCETLRADAERARVLGPYGSEDARRLVNGALARVG